MYGFIHCALEDLIVTKFGRETWEKVLAKSGIRLRGGSFLIHKVYSDDVTLKLVKTTSEILGLEIDTCLEVFGQHFLTFCQQHGYDKILRVLGSNLEDFLTNLDNLHDHLATTYPGMRAPSFRTTTSADGTLHLHYYSERQGLQAIVRGLVQVISKQFFNVEVEVETLRVGLKGDRNSVVFAIRQKHEEDLPVSQGISSPTVPTLSNDPKDLPMNVASFCRAFPFHVMFRRDFTITQVGQSLLRIVKREAWIRRAKFNELFEVCRPIINENFESILEHQNMVFVIQTREDVNHGKLRLKGQMVMVSESNSLLFLCTPRVRNLDEMEDVGVFFSDFPVHDRGRDLILLGHHRRGERELVEKLDEASNHLKVLDKKLRDDKKRTEELLQSIFPGHIAARLCQSLPVEAERFDHVTCLFSDIVGFTAMCSSVTPIDIVRLLNRLYLQFDNLTSTHDIYKVETIGDAYVVVGGVPKFVDNHADRVISMALAMVDVTKFATPPAEGMTIEIRVGVHSGPVVAGVLGVKMPRYCLLGNTVTLANQLESKSKPGKVTISEETRRCLTLEDYEFEANPNTDSLSVTGIFVTKKIREDESSDKSALTVTNSIGSSGGGMFRSPTNSPGHSDEVTNGSNSPSMSPSPHLTFKGMVCIPHIEIPNVEIHSPRTGSPKSKGPEIGRIFVFPPSPIMSSDARCVPVEPVHFEGQTTLHVCPMFSTLAHNGRIYPLSTEPLDLKGINLLMDTPTPPLTPLQPVPKKRAKRWSIMLKNRSWTKRGPTSEESQFSRLQPKARNATSLMLCSCMSAPHRTETHNEAVKPSSKEKTFWNVLSKRKTYGILGRIRLSAKF